MVKRRALACSHSLKYTVNQNRVTCPHWLVPRIPPFQVLHFFYCSVYLDKINETEGESKSISQKPNLTVFFCFQCMIFSIFFMCPSSQNGCGQGSKQYLHRTAVTGSLSHHCDHIPNTTQFSYWVSRFRRANPILRKHGGRRAHRCSAETRP